VTLSEIVTDVKAHFEHGKDLLESHLPALVALAGKAESDPLLRFAVDSLLPASARAMLVDLGTKLEADYKQIEADATANAAAAAAAAAQPAADPAMGDQPAA
jgi:hypothetical protein